MGVTPEALVEVGRGRQRPRQAEAQQPQGPQMALAAAAIVAAHHQMAAHPQLRLVLLASLVS